ncbi:hypothetical protein HMPREF1257_01594 [Corynebacterium sp. KPL1814]|nr:hypothetical protein HMPREF1281_01643 [Corynebacterium sp. KPL1855]ERS63393.1 hypothetical protein HMPREF1257_01594 [Corynebacterium sp. KPL1814]ERS78981.1 hypothetical protein HMPREF1285_01484 [Corynebacterium sp. KPL1859]
MAFIIRATFLWLTGAYAGAGPTPEKWTRRGSGPKIDGNSDIKNYADYLCKEAGAAILA